MTEIEKLYENAGFKKDLPINLADLDFSEEDCDELCLDNSCDECRYKTYPPFTTEKQIELIKWLGEWDYTIRIDFQENEWGIATENSSGYFQDNLSDALASIINNLWQALTEQEQQQIKEILQ